MLGFDFGIGQRHQHLERIGIPAVDIFVIGLVEVGQQALVATCFADAVAQRIGLLQRRQVFKLPGPLRRIVVEQLERVAGDLREAGSGCLAWARSRAPWSAPPAIPMA